MFVVAAATLALCSCAAPSNSAAGTDPTTATTTPTTTTTTSTTMASPPTGTAPTSTSSATVAPEALSPAPCAFETSLVRGRIANPALDEASGLVASRRHRGVRWSHNDGANAGLFALGTDGADLGFHPVSIDGARDIEDIALVSGPAGDEILLADIGDNGANRPSIRIYRIPEPDPAVVATITDVEVLEFVYPDRPHNAEVLLVDEDASRIVIVTKQQQLVDGRPPELGPTGESLVFEGPIEGHGDGPVVLDAIGTVDAPLLETRTVADTPHPFTLLGFGGVPTGGDVAPDGSLIALRTYETVWVWARPAGRSVGETLASEPCQVRVAPEPQGEAVAFLDGTVLTVSEGTNPSLLELGP